MKNIFLTLLSSALLCGSSLEARGLGGSAE